MLTREIADALKDGMKALTVIEGLVMRDAPGDLRLWKERRRVAKRIGRPKRKRRGNSAS